MAESVPSPSSRNAMEAMSREDCESLLAGVTTVGRVAFASASGQQLLPVNFVFRNGRVYFKTAEDSVLAELAEGRTDVAFEIDHPGHLTQHGWSVLVKGDTNEVSADDVDLAPREPRPWAPGERDILVELTPNQVSGRRIGNRLTTPEGQQRRRADAVIGDLLPDQTRDDSAEGWDEREPDRDEQLRRDVPPHHGS